MPEAFILRTDPTDPPVDGDPTEEGTGAGGGKQKPPTGG